MSLLLLPAPEEIIEEMFFDMTDLISNMLMFIVIAEALFLFIYLFYYHQKNKRIISERRNPEEYASTLGVITDVKRVKYEVVKYNKELSELKQKENERNDRKSKKSDELFIKSPKAASLIAQARKEKMADYSNSSDKGENLHIVEKVRKVRYDVSYEFSVPDTDGCTRLVDGEFSVYKLNEDIQKGKEIEVMYKEDRPTSNYTAYSSPIGRL